LALSSWVHDLELLAGPLDRNLFIGCRNDPKALGLLLVNGSEVPGTAMCLIDLLGEQMQVLFATISSSIGYIRDGRLRALAVTTATRSPVLPDIPTVAEFVPGYEASFWSGIDAPKNTTAEIIDKLNKEINEGLADPKMKTRFADLGSTQLPGSPADFGKLIAEETEKMGKVVKFCGAKVD
jgi:tripartite-type tricarboxylate transporter receptor subunit TctC